MKPNALVLRTAGINCEIETGAALRKAGFEVSHLHLNQLLKDKALLHQYQLLVIPGGFSNGDYLGSGKLMANQLRYNLFDEIKEFVRKDNLVLGICNGFQVLLKSGLLTDAQSTSIFHPRLTLVFNDSAHFQCQWVKLKTQFSRCYFTQGLDELYLPIAHAEGKLIAKDGTVLPELYENKQVVLKYVDNPTGSFNSIAGLCDNSGRIFGLMPHPERNSWPEQDPRSLRQPITEGSGLSIFRNAFNYFKGRM